MFEQSLRRGQGAASTTQSQVDILTGNERHGLFGSWASQQCLSRSRRCGRDHRRPRWICCWRMREENTEGSVPVGALDSGSGLRAKFLCRRQQGGSMNPRRLWILPAPNSFCKICEFGGNSSSRLKQTDRKRKRAGAGGGEWVEGRGRGGWAIHMRPTCTGSHHSLLKDGSSASCGCCMRGRGGRFVGCE